LGKTHPIHAAEQQRMPITELSVTYTWNT